MPQKSYSRRPRSTNKSSQKGKNSSVTVQAPEPLPPPPRPHHRLPFQPLLGLTEPELRQFWNGLVPKIQDWNGAHFKQFINNLQYEDLVVKWMKLHPLDLAARSIWTGLQLQKRKWKEHELSPCVPKFKVTFRSSRLVLWRGENRKKEWSLFESLSGLPPLLIDLNGPYGQVKFYNPMSRLAKISRGPSYTSKFKLAFSGISFRIFVFVRPHASRRVLSHGKLLIGHQIKLRSGEINSVRMDRERVGRDGWVYLVKVWIESKIGIRERINFLTPDFGDEGNADISGYHVEVDHQGYEILEILPKVPIKNTFQPRRFQPKFLVERQEAEETNQLLQQVQVSTCLESSHPSSVPHSRSARANLKRKLMQEEVNCVPD